MQAALPPAELVRMGHKNPFEVVHRLRGGVGDALIPWIEPMSPAAKRIDECIIMMGERVTGI